MLYISILIQPLGYLLAPKGMLEKLISDKL